MAPGVDLGADQLRDGIVANSWAACRAAGWAAGGGRACPPEKWRNASGSCVLQRQVDDGSSATPERPNCQPQTTIRCPKPSADGPPDHRSSRYATGTCIPQRVRSWATRESTRETTRGPRAGRAGDAGPATRAGLLPATIFAVTSGTACWRRPNHQSAATMLPRFQGRPSRADCRPGGHPGRRANRRPAAFGTRHSRAGHSPAPLARPPPPPATSGTLLRPGPARPVPWPWPS